MSFTRLLNPRSTVVLGSVKENKIAHQIFIQMTRGGYTGDLLSVNPSAERPFGMEGIPAYESIADVPGELDLAVLAVPARFVADSLTECGKKGIPFAVILTSGFSETGNAFGEKKIREIATAYGIRLIGPNCAGIMSTPSRLFASIEKRALPGRTALVSQSGAVGAAALALAGERGIGFSHFLSIGNRADVDESDLLDYLAGDEATSLAALYLESVADGRKFLTAATAFCRAKPLVLIKAGKSEAGVRAASSHTGSMAGSDAVFEAACRQTGILRVDGIEEMLDLCCAFEHYPVPRGNRLLVVTNSGGPGILTCDRAEGKGLLVPPPPEELKGLLKKTLLPNASLNNPIDLTVEGTEEHYALVVQEGLKAGYDAAIAINVGTPFLDSSGLAEGIVRGASAVPEKPVIPIFMAGDIVAGGTEILVRSGRMPLPTGERAAAALAAMAARGSGGIPADRDWAGKGPSVPPAGEFLEPEQVRFLSERGFPLPAWGFAVSEEEAAAAAGEAGYPAVLKVVSPEILHKSDVGGVVLNIRNADELSAAYREMTGRLSSHHLRGVMVYRQVPAGREFILGAKRDADFGPVILLGAGGVMSEIIRDVTLRIAPLSRDDCREMMSELKFSRIIEGFRGEAPLAKEALTDLMLKLSALVTEESWIEELDLNPVFLSHEKAIIGDVRILLPTE